MRKPSSHTDSKGAGAAGRSSGWWACDFVATTLADLDGSAVQTLTGTWVR